MAEGVRPLGSSLTLFESDHTVMSSGPLMCAPCPRVPVPTCPLATFGRVEVQRSNGTA